MRSGRTRDRETGRPIMLTLHLGRFTQLAASLALAAGLAVTSGALPSGAAKAQDFPSKPVQLIVPYRAGGGTDTMARVFAKALVERAGRSPSWPWSTARAAAALSAARFLKNAPMRTAIRS